jgi:hypothetical protein
MLWYNKLVESVMSSFGFVAHGINRKRFLSPVHDIIK